MHQRSRRAVATGIAVLVVTAALPAAAQQPPDVVFEPLVTAAESERAAQPSLAHAHAEAALRYLPDGSPVAVRARAVFDGTAAGAAAPTEDQLWAPLVDAAENDAAGGRRDVALDRLTAVMRIASPASAIATRARRTYAIMTGGAPPAGGQVVAPPPGGGAAAQLGQPGGGQVAPPPGGQNVPPPPGYGQPLYGQPGYGQPGYGQPYGVPPPRYNAPPRDPTLRGTGEVIPLYAIAAGDGVMTGVWVLVSADVDPGTYQGAYSLIPLLTGGLFATGVWGLDQINGGLRTGQPGAISAGAVTGAIMAPFIVGYMNLCPRYVYLSGYRECDPSWHTPSSSANWSVAWVSGAVGLLGGIGYAFGVKPRPAAAFMAEATSLWGMFFGGMIGLGVQDAQTTMLTMAVGVGAGVVLGAVLGQAIRPSMGRVGLLMAGFAAGVAVASLPFLIISTLPHGTQDPGWIAAALSIGGLGGLILFGALTGNMVDDEGHPTAPPVSVGAAPLANGGAEITVQGTF